MVKAASPQTFLGARDSMITINSLEIDVAYV